MRREKAIRIARDWANRICIHPYKEDEYYLGQPTNNKVCVVCGQIFGKKSTIDILKNIIKKRI